MAASMWRMNGFWRRMAELLVLSALLLSNEVTCQSEAPITTAAAAAASPSAVPDVTASGQPAAPTANAVTTRLPTMAVTSQFISTIVSRDISRDTGELSQNENEVPAIKTAPEKTSSSSDSSSGSSSSTSSGSSVFVGILVSGLLAALAIIVGYFKCQRRSDTQCVKLAEEAYPVDQENQGNTLVSVAPLNPPPETQEKPSINGESTEPAKTEPPAPPTNGHSTAKTADTEL